MQGGLATHPRIRWQRHCAPPECPRPPTAVTATSAWQADTDPLLGPSACQASAALDSSCCMAMAGWRCNTCKAAAAAAVVAAAAAGTLACPPSCSSMPAAAGPAQTGAVAAAVRSSLRRLAALLRRPPELLLLPAQLPRGGGAACNSQASAQRAQSFQATLPVAAHAASLAGGGCGDPGAGGRHGDRPPAAVKGDALHVSHHILLSWDEMV
jgi:hypothetical protein